MKIMTNEEQIVRRRINNAIGELSEIIEQAYDMYVNMDNIDDVVSEKARLISEYYCVGDITNILKHYWECSKKNEVFPDSMIDDYIKTYLGVK